MVPIPLDPSIKLWMLIPIFLITTLATLLRQALAELNQASSPGGAPPSMMPGGKVTLTELHTSNVVAASRITRGVAALLTPSSLLARKRYYLGENEDGKLCNPPEAGLNPLQSMMQQDPSKMAGAMKYNMGFLLLNGGLAYLISYLFSECVVAKTPFPLTRSFKGILQRGIDVDNLDSSYVSALSWYFLVLFCSTSYSFLMNAGLGLVKGPAVSAMEAMDPMMGAMMSGGPMSNPDPSKAFGQEADSWKLMSQVPFLEGVDKAVASVLKT